MKRIISTGVVVVIYLHSPREKIWGQLLELNAAGITICGIDLGAFDDWLRSLTTGEVGFGLSTSFLPMWRVERVLLDQSAGGVPGLEDQLRQRLGISLAQLLEQSELGQPLSDESEPPRQN